MSKKKPQLAKAFVTGSRAYGLPGIDSDIDLVVLISTANLDRLLALGGTRPAVPGDEDYIAAGGTPLRFGSLNLICCTDKAQYDVWSEGTKRLKMQAPVSRDFAIRFMAKLREEAGFQVPTDE